MTTASPLPTKRPAARYVIPVLCAGALAGCGGSSTDAEPLPGVRVVSGTSQSDTAGAPLSEPLVVQAVDSLGLPLAGVLVTFRARAPGGVPRGGGVRRDAGSWFREAVPVLTDAEGRAAMFVRLDTLAGTTNIDVSADTPTLIGTAAFEASPGPAAALVTQPYDTALLVGGQFALRAQVEDGFRNARPDPVTYAATGPGTVSATGVVRGTAIGRVQVTARGAGLTSTPSVSIVPTATFAAVERPDAAGAAAAIVTFRSDGATMRTVLRPTGALPPAATLWPTWNPAGDRLAYAMADGLLVTDLAGQSVNLVSELAGTDAFGPARFVVAADFAPQYSADGRWLYFTASSASWQHAIWRVPATGGAATVVTPTTVRLLDASPAPEPGGLAITYQSSASGNDLGSFNLRRFTLASGGVSDLGIVGASPRWSPTGTTLAHLTAEGRIRLVDANGTGGRLLGSSTARPGFGWSPDGAWLLIDTGTELRLVRLASGEELPLAFRGPNGGGLAQPSWRP